MKPNVQMQVIKITQYREECVFATETLGYTQLPLKEYNVQELNNIAKQLGGDYLVSVSTNTKGIIYSSDKEYQKEVKLYKHPV